MLCVHQMKSKTSNCMQFDTPDKLQYDDEFHNYFRSRSIYHLAYQLKYKVVFTVNNCAAADVYIYTQYAHCTWQLINEMRNNYSPIFFTLPITMLPFNVLGWVKL